MSNTAALIVTGLVIMLTNAIEGVTGFGSAVIALPFLNFTVGLHLTVKSLCFFGWLVPIYIIARSHKHINWRDFVGYDDAVAETARLTEARPELDEQAQRVINERVAYVADHIQTAERLWDSTLGLPARENGYGLIDDCTTNRNGEPQDNGVMLRPDDPEMEKKKDDCFRRACYLAKTTTKGNAPKGQRELFSSLIHKK